MLFATIGLLVFCLSPGAFLSAKLLPEKKSLSEYLALSILISASFNYSIMFGLGLFKAIGLFSVLTIELLSLLALLFLRKISIPSFGSAPFIPKISKAEAVICSLIAVILAFQFINMAFFPFFAYDSVRSYNEWAKEIYRNGAIPVGYPPFTQTTYAFIYLFDSPASENFAHLLSFPFLLMSLFYLYLLGRKSGGIGIIPVALLIMTPWFLPVSNSGYSDIFSLAFVLSSCYYLLKSSSDRTLSSAFLSGLFGGMAASTKLYSPYLILMLPASFFIFSVLRNPSRERLMQLLVLGITVFLIGSHWEIRNIALGSTYVQKTFFSHSIDPADTVLLWGPERATDYLARPGWALNSFLESTPPQISIPVILGVAFAFYLVLVKRGPVAAPLLLGLGFLPIWFFFLSFDIRHLLIVYPLFLVASSILLKEAWDKIRRPVLILVLVSLLLLPPFFDALGSSAIGSTRSSLQFPSHSYSINHLFDSDEGKRAAVFGDFYNIVIFIKSNEEIRGATLHTIDSRIKSYLEGVKFDKEDADYLVFSKDLAFKKWDKPSWIGTDVEDDLRGNRSRFFSTVYSSGTYRLLKIDKEAVETYMRDRNA